MNQRLSACLLSALLFSTDCLTQATPLCTGGSLVQPASVVADSQWKGKRVAFLGDSITDKRHIGTTKCWWEYLAEMLGLQAFSYGINGNRMDGVLRQAQQLLVPLVGSNAGTIFALALLLAGVSSTITSGIAGASIFAGFYGESYHHRDLHSRLGVLLSYLPALVLIFVIGDPFEGLIVSQMVLSLQLPITVFTQVFLTSNKRVMGKFVNSRSTTVLLLVLGSIVTILNLFLLVELIIG